MRFFLVFAILLCVAGGAWLLHLPEFYWPARSDPTLALHLAAPATYFLGSALLIIAALGVMVITQAQTGRLANRNWRYTHFTLILLTVTLLGATIWHGEIVPNPESSAAQNRP